MNLHDEPDCVIRKHEALTSSERIWMTILSPFILAYGLFMAGSVLAYRIKRYYRRKIWFHLK